ncbi:putative butyrophilin subfamily 2 member A3 [Crotalus tigris]|uniref:putative butyrophilin subfamily 2 member A3 n=1 Tax=Crotalus tigris TaxID=88082 RepID=UPI00192F289B|nr:putative butyrophilin subfamily 2 member A3 [Crotalus tigris]
MDEDGYMSIDPSKRDHPLPAIKGKKDPSVNPLVWKVLLGISTVGNVALAVLLIVLTLPASEKFSEPNLPSKPIPSCLMNCIPCRSAKDSDTANLTLDPNTAHPKLYVSPDLKSVRWTGTNKHMNSSPLNYDVMDSVLSHQGFNSGKWCWEVEVVEGGDWWAGLIAFFDGDMNAEIFTFPKANFAGEKIHTWFLIYKWNGQLLLHL